MTQRYFTVAEAESMIPRLEETFRRIHGLRDEVDRRMEQVQILDVLWSKRVEAPGNPDHREWIQHRDRVHSAVEEIETLVAEEILGLGVRFPQGGLEWGLVDFPTLLEGRVVYLCWRSGESAIRAWHEVHEGFAGRRTLTEHDARRMGPGQGAGEE